jgi:hypothetical protein
MALVGTCSNNSYWDQVRSTTCTNDQTGASGNPLTTFPVNQGSVPDLHITADTAAWFSLGSPFNLDPDNVTRTSSIGAFQFVSGGGGAPSLTGSSDGFELSYQIPFFRA